MSNAPFTGTLRVLLVDDSTLARAVLADLFIELGAQVREADQAVQALEVLASGALVDLLVTDLNMPGLDGLGLVKMVRSDPVLNELPILVVSSQTDQGGIAEALAAGASEYLMKPVNRELLESKLALLGLSPSKL